MLKMVYIHWIFPKSRLTNNINLIVDVDGVSYTAKEELVLSGTFDSAIQGDGQLFSGNETEVLITLTDLSRARKFLFI